MNKVILITGNRKGIGRHLSEYYLSKGFYVAGCSRSENDLRHENYLHALADVSDENQCKAVVRKVKNAFGKIDVLINNAGIASMNHSLLTPGTTVRKVFSTNFEGSFFFSRECAKVMIKEKFGRIINYSSVAVPMDLEGELIYASSKAAVEKMTKIMAKELAPFNITVNALGPTPIYTDLIKTIPKNKIQDLIDRQVIKRIGEFSDLEPVMDFFIDDKSSFITSQIIYLGGL